MTSAGRPIAVGAERLWLFLALLVVLVVAFFSYRAWSAFGRQSEQIAITQRVVEGSNALLASVTEAETGQRGFLLTGRDVYLGPYREALKAIPGQLNSLEQATSARPDQRDRLERLKPLIRAKLNELQETIDLHNREDPRAAAEMVLTDQGKQEMDQIRQECREIQSVAYERLSLQSAQAFSSANLMGFVSAAGSLVLFTLLILSAIAIQIGTSKRRDLIQNLLEMAAIIESSEDAIISKDLKGIVTSWNRGAERIFGYSREEMIGLPISILASPGRADEMPRILAQISKGERIEHYETMRRTKDGRDIDISLTVSPIRDNKGSIIGASKISRDITERVVADKERRRQAEVIERSNSDLEHFAYAASHDLREPLRTIAVYGQILERQLGPQLDAESASNLQAIQAATGRMAHLIDGLLDYSKVGEAGRSPQEIDTELALGSALANLQGAIEGSQAVITHDPFPCVPGNELHFVQLFQNVISNAVKYRSDEAPRIHLSAHRQEGDGASLFATTARESLPNIISGFLNYSNACIGRTIQGAGLGLQPVRRSSTNMADGFGWSLWQVRAQLSFSRCLWRRVAGGRKPATGESLPAAGWRRARRISSYPTFLLPTKTERNG